MGVCYTTGVTFFKNCLNDLKQTSSVQVVIMLKLIAVSRWCCLAVRRRAGRPLDAMYFMLSLHSLLFSFHLDHAADDVLLS